MQSLYAPVTITDNWFKLPYEAMAQSISASGIAYNNNIESLGNLTNKMSELRKLKTFDELQPELQSEIGRYGEAIDKATKTLKENPSLYLSAGPELKALGVEIANNINSGNISKYVNAYQQYTTGLKEELDDKSKNPDDVNRIYAVNKQKIIDALRKGEDPGAINVPRSFNLAESLSDWAKEFKPSTIKDADGNMIEQVNLPALRQYLLNRARTDSDAQGYFHSMQTQLPDQYGTIYATDAKGNKIINPATGKPMYVGRKRDKTGNLIVDKDGNYVEGNTGNEHDAITYVDRMIDQAVRNELLSHQNFKKEEGKGTSANSIKPDSGVSLVTADEAMATSTGKSEPYKAFKYWTTDLKDPNNVLNDVNNPLYVLYHDIKDNKGNVQRSLNSILKDTNASATERENARQQWEALRQNYLNQRSEHEYIGQIAERNLNLRGIKTRDEQGNPLIGSEAVKRAKKKLNAYKPSPFEFSLKPHDLKDELKRVEQLDKDYQAEYLRIRNNIISQQNNQTNGIGISNNKGFQDKMGSILMNYKTSVTMNGADATKYLDGLGNEVSDKLSFEQIYPETNGSGVVIKALDIESKKPVKFIIHDPKAIQAIQQHIHTTPGMSEGVKLFANALGNSEYRRVYNVVTNAKLPVSGYNYGPKNEFTLGPLSVEFRKTPSGNIIYSFKVNGGPSRSGKTITGSNTNGQFIDEIGAILEAIKQGQSFNGTQPIAPDQKKYYIDPNQVSIFPGNS